MTISDTSGSKGTMHFTILTELEDQETVLKETNLGAKANTFKYLTKLFDFTDITKVI